MANRFEKVTKRQYLCDSDNRCCAYEELKLPKRATTGSAGYDFYSTKDFRLSPNETVLLPTGIRVLLDDDKVLLMVPRSGLGFKYRTQLDNSVGVIDFDYAQSDNEGHIKIKLTNDSKDGKILEIKKGEAIAQGIITYFIKTDDDCTTAIRNGGFGSTSNVIGTNNNKDNHSVPLDCEENSVCLCTAKCKTPCGRKGKISKLIYAAMDFGRMCTRYEADLDQFDSIFDAVNATNK